MTVSIRSVRINLRITFFVLDLLALGGNFAIISNSTSMFMSTAVESSVSWEICLLAVDRITALPLQQNNSYITSQCNSSTFHYLRTHYCWNTFWWTRDLVITACTILSLLFSTHVLLGEDKLCTDSNIKDDYSCKTNWSGPSSCMPTVLELVCDRVQYIRYISHGYIILHANRILSHWNHYRHAH